MPSFINPNWKKIIGRNKTFQHFFPTPQFAEDEEKLEESFAGTDILNAGTKAGKDAGTNAGKFPSCARLEAAVADDPVNPMKRKALAAAVAAAKKTAVKDICCILQTQSPGDLLYC